MRVLIYMVLLLVGLSGTYAAPLYSQNVNNFIELTQQDTLNFPASRLSEAAATYAGGAQNWPIISYLADYDSRSNRFSISPDRFPDLLRFRESWHQLEESRATFSRLILEGGRVFAADELLVIDSLLVRHRREVSDANIDGSIQAANQIRQRIVQVDELITSRRKADIEARLEQKTGQVDRRQGLLAQWNPALLGELFARQDGIRTGAESLAQLVFLDGSDVVLYENTTAIIRQSQVDRLTNRSEVEIELSNGGLLTRLSTAARNQSEYTLNAGSASTNVRSNNFFAEAASADRVSMSNFDGEVLVRAEAGQVLLQENEGTIVVRGREPLAPIRLLVAPELGWASQDSVIYNDNVILRWGRVDGAEFYEVDVASNRTFDAGLRTTRTGETRVEVTQIPTGISYLQVRAFDENGLRGNNTRPFRLLRISTDAPPPIILDQRDRSVIYSFERDFILSGTTQPGAELTLNGEPAAIDAVGRFALPITIDDQFTAQLTSTDPAGNTRSITQAIQYINTDALFNIRWSVPVSGNRVQRAPRILLSGTAYSFMQVHIQAGDQSWRMPVGANRSWSRQITPGTASEIKLIFTDRTTGEVIAERTYELN